jgi:hypothetical protein
MEHEDSQRANALRVAHLPPVWFRHLLFSAPISGLFIPYEMLFLHSGIRGSAHFPITDDMQAPMYLCLEINRHESQRVLCPNGVFRREPYSRMMLTEDGTQFTPQSLRRMETMFNWFCGSRWVFQRLFDDPDWQSAYRNVDHYADQFRRHGGQSNADRRVTLLELLRQMQNYYSLHPDENFALHPNGYPHWFLFFLAGCHTDRAMKHVEYSMQIIYHFRLHIPDHHPRPSTLACINLLRMFDRVLQSDWDPHHVLHRPEPDQVEESRRLRLLV